MSDQPIAFGPGCDVTGMINYDLPPRGVSFGRPLGPNIRNYDCRIDSHEDPDNSGLCIHCSVVLCPEDESAREWNRKRWTEYTGAPGDPEIYED